MEFFFISNIFQILGLLTIGIFVNVHILLDCLLKIIVFQVNVNQSYQADELLYCINKVGIKALICADEFKATHYYHDVIEKIIPEISKMATGTRIACEKVPSLKHIIFTSNQQYG